MSRTSTPAPFRFAVALVCLLLPSWLSPVISHAQAQSVSPGEGLVADTTELRVLRQFYAATGGPQWHNQSNWFSGTTLADASTWYGVGVQDGDVVRLDLYANGLRGQLPASVGELRGLQSLSLPVNQLAGVLPASVGQLARLTNLSLWQNQFTGPIPPELGQLAHLRTLSLTQNALNGPGFTGPIPPELGQLTQLVALGLGVNGLSGPIPPELGNLTQLQQLDLYANHLTGSIPASLGQLSQLQSLSLAVNGLVGPLPPELGRLAQLESLQLWQNNFQDSIPAAWGALAKLRELNLGQAELVGRLPKELGQLTALQSVSFYMNRFVGALPAELGNWRALRAVSFDWNGFTGPVPASFGQWTQVEQVRASNNRLSGPLPAEVGRWRQLTFLGLDNNQLTGPLPDSLGYCARLGTLSVSRNQFTGSLALLARLANLREVNASQNRFSGPLPLGFGMLADLQYVYLDENRLTGPLPAAPGAWPALRHLTLVNNHVSGALPAALVRRPGLSLLRLNNNDLADVEDLGGATGLPASVDVSGNFLGFAALERLHQGPHQARFPHVDARWQRPPVRVDTAAFAPGGPLTLRVAAAPAGHARGYQWQREVGGQWVALPGDTLAAVTWPAAPAAAQGRYRRVEHNAWFTDGALVPTELYSAMVYADLLPYAPLARNRPDDANYATALADTAGTPEARARPAAGDVNYVRTWTPRVALTDSTQVPHAAKETVAMATTYLDGLGRSVQTVQHRASPQGRDLVQPQAYDALDREPKQYLPYAAAGDARTPQGYHYQALADQQAFYYRTGPRGGGMGPLAPDDPIRGVARTGVAFAESGFEASPLNRVTAQGAAGEAWQLTSGHVVERTERPNTAADSVLRFAPGYDPAVVDPGYQGFYAPGELWGTEVADAHGPTEIGAHGYRTLEWKDKEGQLVLRQVEVARTGTAATPHSRWLRTAYAYDDFGRLRYVLQPEGTKRVLTPGPPRPVPGTIGREEWAKVPGTAVSDIPLAQPPTTTGVLSSLEGPTDVADNYGDRIRGFLIAPQTGDYRFWVAGDDNCEFWLSPDEDPAHKQRLAYVPGWTPTRQWTWYAAQASAPVALVAGQRYYLEVLHKEGGGGDNVAVTWQRPDGTGYGVPIPGAFLTPYAPVTSAPAPYMFHYRYDGRGRQIAKQVPGTDGETVVVFDQLDRPVLSQDAAQRARREWAWTKYDALGRIVLSGLVVRGDTAGQVTVQALADANATPESQYEQRAADGAAYPHFVTTDQSFPRLGQQGFGPGTVLSATYYDDYNFDNDAAGVADASYNTSTDGQFLAGAAPAADAVRTTGMTTRTKTRVLGVDPADPTQAAWLTTTTFYDERARPVQVQATNARKGLDLLTTQLDFTGKVVQSVAVHEGPNHAPVTVAEFFTYDHTGRLLTTRQQLPGEARPVRIDSVAYNELGQTTQKTMGTGRLAQQVDFAYNIRGWLTQLNDPYHPVAGDLFNLSLHYDQDFSKGYEQYNGNLTGQTWRSSRDGVQRAYGYVYDPLNRLLQGDFVARTAAAAATPNTAGLWKSEEDNYRLSFASYDDNGNLLTLRRRGLLANATHARAKQFGAVDALTYAYAGNRLQAVDDAVSTNQLPRPLNYNGAPTSLAGDFQEGGAHLGQEYLYDANGNLTQDRNKGLTGIAYNHLNLPRLIRFGIGADSLVFRYSAAGQKVAKLVYQTGQPVRRTDYLGPYQYEQDSLRFFPHAEGRVLRFANTTSGAVRYQREFTFKDHLGNLRLAYRLGQVRTYTATLEQDAPTHGRESQQFDSLSVSPPVAQPVGSRARTGTYAARLNAGGSAPQPLGPLTQFAVQKGDTVRVTAPGMYPQATNNNSFAFSLAGFVASLLNPAPGAPAGADGARRGGLPLLQIGLNAAVLNTLAQLPGGVPKGYLRVLSFNEDSVLVDQRTVQLTAAALNNYEALATGPLVVQQNGYVSVYVGNESAADVYFDDVAVEHRQGLQVQENQYDPFGLDLAGVSGAAPGLSLKNFYQFNGKENQLDLGLNWNHQDWRFFDYQIGRWHVVDPEIENEQDSWTPYSFGFDNAVRYADADGRYPGGGDGLVGQAVEFFNGAANAIASNASTLGPVSGIHRTTDRTGAFAEGQKAGDVVSLVQAAGEMLLGGTMVVGGTAGGAVTAPTGVGAVAGAATAVAGFGVAGHGAVTGQNAWNNLFNKGDGRVNASSTNSNKTSGNNSAAQRGKQEHKAFADKLKAKGNGWDAEVTMTGKNGKKYRVDGLTPTGNVLELKPNTARGRSRGASQARTYEKQLGRKTRVVYY